MARLDDLSTELILDILGRIPPEDLESTTFISKTVYPIARTLLNQHREVLVQQYERWTDAVKIKKTHPLYGCKHMHASLLCTILTDRRLAKMVKTLTFRNFQVSHTANSELGLVTAWKPDELFPGPLPGLRKSQRLTEAASRTRFQILEEAVCQYTLVSPKQKESWLKDLHTGNEELATILLLWHLPTLQSISLDLGSTERIDIRALLQLVEYAISESNRPSSAHIPPGLPLQSIDSVLLTFNESRSEDIALVRAFLSLPRLSYLFCRNLSVSSVRRTISMGRLAERSAINALNFRDCTLDIAALLSLLEGATTVTRVSCTWHRSAFCDAYDYAKFGPSAVVAALVGSTGHKLETLELLARSSVEVQYIDTSLHFRDFRALKLLELSTNIILAEDGRNLSSFVFMLPEGLEQLTLRWIKDAPISDIRTFITFLKTFADQAEVYLTTLRELRIVGYLDVDEMRELPSENAETGCRKLGHLTLSVRSHRYLLHWR